MATGDTSRPLSPIEDPERARMFRWLAYLQFPLKEGEIRLLHLSLDPDEAMIDCETHTVKLANAGEYTAISYVWGSDNSDQEIRLNGSRFLVRRNLYTALRNIRSTVRRWATADGIAGDKLGVIPLWIDGLCIDQDNLDELAAQIQHMHLIYQRAPRVYICINEDLEKVRPVTYVLRWINLYRKHRKLPDALAITRPDYSSEPQDDSLASYSSHLLHRFDISHQNLLAIFYAMEHPSEQGTDDVTAWLAQCPRKEDFPPGSHAFWTAVAAFAQLDYFRRVWCFQEVMLASKAEMLILRLGRGSEAVATLFEDQLGFPRSQTTRFDQFRIMTGSDSSTALLLLHNTQRRCRRPHDYVYGLLGFMAADVRERITVDYNIPAGLVFANAVKATLDVASKHDDPEVRDANLVAHLWDDMARVPAAVDGLPSWCPDFSNAQNAPGFLSFCNGPKLSPEIVDSFLDQVRYPPVRDVGVLALNVASIGVVSRCSSSIWRYNSSTKVDGVRSGVTTHESINTWFANLGNTSPHRDRRGRVLGFNHAVQEYIRTSENELDEAHLAARDSDSGFQCLSLDEICSVSPDDGDKEDAAAAAAASGDENSAEADKDGASRERAAQERLQLSLEYILKYQQGRCIFQLETGQMGFAPRAVMPGSKPCIVPGSIYLHLLSPENDQYVSCAWIHNAEEFLGQISTEGVVDRWEIVHLH